MGNRHLSPKFMDDLLVPSGVLHELLCRVKADDTLDLQIRDDAINVYYRGLNLVEVSLSPASGYKFHFDPNYFRPEAALPGTPTRAAVMGNLPNPVVRVSDCQLWLLVVPLLKDAIDRYFTIVKAAREKEIQQVMVRENNYGDPNVATATDYFVIDVEYAKDDHGRADLVAVCWPSTPHVRTRRKNRRLAIVELKFGDGEVAGRSGLLAHVKNAGLLAANATRIDFCKEMLDVYAQKHALGLLGGAPPLASVDDTGLDFIIVVANHDPAKSALKRELAAIIGNYPANLTLWVASASQFGYGLFADKRHMTPLEDFYKSLP